MMAENFDRRKTGDAVLYYERAFRAYPASQVAAYGLANSYIQSSRPEKAIPICAAILAFDFASIRFAKLKAYAYYKAGETGPAIEQFHKTIALGDSSSFTFKHMGISQYVAADVSGALSSLQKAVKLDSLDAESHFFLGASLGYTKEKEEALYHLDRSLELMQPDPSALARIYSEKGNLFRLQGRYEAAYHSFRQAWEADTMQPMSLYYMASILDNSLHRLEEALVDYQRFIDELDRMPAAENEHPNMSSVRSIVEDRIVSLKEELFFLDR
jgi:tetratricopeptide (TPR) repeat protein